MANELDPRSTGFSVEDQLNAFRVQLDEVANPRGRLSIPGFLFKNGDERSRVYSPHELEALRIKDPDYLRFNPDAHLGLVAIHEGELIAQHVETYRKGIENRHSLLAKIKPIEILEVVRDVWGKGEIKQTDGGGILTYRYLKPENEVVVGQYTTRGGRVGPEWSSGTKYYTIGKSGKWRAYELSVQEEVVVNFGNAKFLDGRHELPKEYFVNFNADLHRERAFKLPQKIWKSSDNLGIIVTVPYVVSTFSLPRVRDYSLYYRPHEHPVYTYPYRREIWFNQPASQQEIMDYLVQQLEAQKAVGQLPSQIEAVELAKIEELRKRGLFAEGKPIAAHYKPT